MDVILRVIFLLFAFLSVTRCLPVKDDGDDDEQEDSSPMHSQDFYQGDIVLSKEARKAAEAGNLTLADYGGAGAFDKKFGSVVYGRWPNGKVPYVISRVVAGATSAIRQAIALYHKHTCIRFAPRRNERSYILFTTGSGCTSPVGMSRRGPNRVTLARGCWRRGIVQHEVGHSLGMFHEQSRPDRDKFVRIITRYIRRGLKFAFDIQRGINSLGTPYDLRSMMHYSSNAFSIDGRSKTILTRDRSKQYLIDNNNRISGFSKIDIKQLNLMYKCKTKPEGTCIDKEDSCQSWTKAGYCSSSSKHFKYMQNNCCASCTKGKGKKKKKTATTKTPTTTSRCTADRNKYCGAWSKKGYCSPGHKHFDYMKKTCCASCQKSGTTKPPRCTTDKNKYCAGWMKAGYCVEDHDYFQYMRQNCCASCKKPVCTGPDKKERKSDCEGWKRQGTCREKDFRAYLKETCCGSCGTIIQEIEDKETPAVSPEEV